MSNKGQQDKLGFGRRLGYGVADFGLNLYYTGLNLFLYFYYTDVLEIRPAVAGLIFAVPLVWDAVTDPVMGILANKTRTRFGSYRPYILFGMVPLALSFVAMFAAPLLFPGAVVATAAITHVIFRTCYTVVSIPYGALSANLTRNSTERGKLAGVRMFFAPLGGLFTAFLTLQLAGKLGAGDLKVGFLQVAALYGGVACLLFTLTFLTTREQLAAKADVWPGLRACFRQLASNRALWILIGAIIWGSTGSAIFGKAILYYLRYMPGVTLDISLALTAFVAATTISVPFWTIISGRVAAKRNVWLTGSCITITLQLLLLLLQPSQTPVLLAIMFGFGIAGGAYYLSFWSMLPDTVEYGQFRSGVRDEGVVFGINQLALKAATGLGIGLLGVMLEAFGYVANQAQTPEALTGIRFITLVLPLLFGLLSAGTIIFYPIDFNLHRRLVRVLDWRAARKANRAT